MAHMRINDRCLRDIAAAVRQEDGISPPQVVHDLNAWLGLAAELPTYAASPEDYIGDLFVRDRLQAVCAQLGRAMPRSLSAPLRAADSNFLRVTIEDTDRLLARYVEASFRRDWWWGRIPAKGPLAQELAQYF